MPWISHGLPAEPGEPPLITLVLLMSHTTNCPLVLLYQRMSLLLSPLKSPVSAIVHGLAAPPPAAAVTRRAVQQPDHCLPSARVEPEDVALAIAVEVAGAGDRPWAWHRTGRAAADHARAVEQPDQRLPGDGVVPEDIAHPV